jgi:hypothetical protein
MRQLIARFSVGSCIAVLVAFAMACDDASRSVPASPSALSRPSSPFADRYTAVALGQVVVAQVGTDDVACDAAGFYCRYYRVTVPREGTLEVGFTHSLGRIFFSPGLNAPIDMWLTRASGHQVWMEGYRGADIVAHARTAVSAGETVQVAVISYEVPGVAFELTFSLR